MLNVSNMTHTALLGEIINTCHISIQFIPANSPSLVRSLRHFRLASISVRGDRNLRHLSIGFFSSFFRFPAIISYFPVIITISVVGKKTAMASRRSGSPCAGNSNARKNKNSYKAHFNPYWVKEWPALIAPSNKGDTYAFCRLCRCDVSVSSGESKTHSVTSLIVTRCHL